MIKRNTIFILGAGASCHYGYPVGEGLVNLIIDIAGRLGMYCQLKADAPSITLPIPIYVASKVRGTQSPSTISEAWHIVSKECTQSGEANKMPLPPKAELQW